jgi:hypothetical protein
LGAAAEAPLPAQPRRIRATEQERRERNRDRVISLLDSGQPVSWFDVFIDGRITPAQIAILREVKSLTVDRRADRGGPIAAVRMCKRAIARKLGAEWRRFRRDWDRLMDLRILQRFDANTRHNVPGVYGLHRSLLEIERPAAENQPRVVQTLTPQPTPAQQLELPKPGVAPRLVPAAALPSGMRRAGDVLAAMPDPGARTRGFSPQTLAEFDPKDAELARDFMQQQFWDLRGRKGDPGDTVIDDQLVREFLLMAGEVRKSYGFEEFPWPMIRAEIEKHTGTPPEKPAWFLPFFNHRLLKIPHAKTRLLRGTGHYDPPDSPKRKAAERTEARARRYGAS